ncbi:AAA family ATPase [Muricauda sp. SCSIO 64092]|uniref:AAA family ATPase n=1 Tax=Allomuricauda sp. SCSIO 64092 TaxID=2908842 RepID=UPI001FF68735|nr:AAA family ATPase [Muricauda sp. SCSIO 64092]UOY05383.1 AAA family ATPase [Muricauda sp. SCSIO 64092]
MIYVDRNTVERPISLSDEVFEDAQRQLLSNLAKDESILKQKRVKGFRVLYNSKEVKEALRSLFHGKCSYCEQPLTDKLYLTVDHFRPKQLATDSIAGLRHLYYSWLINEWENLLPSCPECNSAKFNYFPLKRYANFQESVEGCRKVEKDAILDPCFDRKISAHLKFLRDGTVKAKSERGEKTIELLSLNRKNLVRLRKKRWESVMSQLQTALKWEDNVRTLARFAKLMDQKQPFVAVSRTAGMTLLVPLVTKIGTMDTISDLMKHIWEGDIVPASIQELTSLMGLEKAMEPELISQNQVIPPKIRLISSVELTDYKALEDLKISFPSHTGQDSAPCLMLLGENATGKSTILEAITLCLLRENHGKALKLDPQSLLPFGRPTAKPRVSIHFNPKDGTDHWEFGVSSRKAYWKERDSHEIPVIAFGAHRFVTNIRRYRQRHIQVQTLFDPSKGIPDLRKWLVNAPAYKFNAVARAMKDLLLIPLDQDTVMTRNKDEGTIGFELFGQTLDLSYLSEGYKTIITLSLNVMRVLLEYNTNLEHAHGVVLIDEIETHLHPRWKMQIVSGLRKAMPMVQFVFTTHDPLCLKGMRNDEVVVLQRNEDSKIESLKDLPPIEGLRVEQILTSPYFGLFSALDPEVEINMIRYANLAASTNTSDNDQQLKEFRDQIESEMVIGRNPLEEIGYKAALRTIEDKRTRIADLSNINDDVFKEALDILNKKPEDL